MNLPQAWEWLESFTNLEKKPQNTQRTWRLDRMNELLRRRGNPERGRKTIHVAGSKGKGTTCAFLASIVTQAGYKTGLYSSPHVFDWRERITLNGDFFEESVYTDEIESLKTFWETPDVRVRFETDWGGPPTTFEWLTLAAFEIFRNQNCDAAVLETGLGGRLDATNVVEPVASCLTLIEKEHTEILGDTLELIAGEKAGIIKPGNLTLIAPQTPEVERVFLERCQAAGSKPFLFRERVRSLQLNLEPQGIEIEFSLKPSTVLHARIPLLGEATARNAAFAAFVISTLVEKKALELRTEMSLEKTIESGWIKTKLLGRMQIVQSAPLAVVDGAHTEQSVQLLVRSWNAMAGRGTTLIFGAFQGKDIDAMAKELVSSFRTVVLTPPGFYRPSDVVAMKTSFERAAAEANLPQGSPEIVVCERPEEAWIQAQSFQKPILVCGSFYLVGEILNILKRR